VTPSTKVRRGVLGQLKGKIPDQKFCLEGGYKNGGPSSSETEKNRGGRAAKKGRVDRGILEDIVRKECRKRIKLLGDFPMSLPYHGRLL